LKKVLGQRFFLRSSVRKIVIGNGLACGRELATILKKISPAQRNFRTEMNDLRISGNREYEIESAVPKKERMIALVRK
jgi:hypothetical protein